MSELVRFQTDEGAELVVEVDDDAPGLERISRDSHGVAQATRDLEAALAQVQPSLRRVVAMVRSLSPDSHEVEFGLKLNAEAGAVIAKTSIEGHFVVRMTWEGRQRGAGA
ncbi:hypothetical protein Cs7R123_44810 [Catellatospora sp. TT07R-123]|uniref:CU044_2847 family protein n=1 Tax=Catellatospora sp. TT07R-123 TaxID=2733863 RepID=UPI001B0F6F48|nr:CU044_2847 family protein [Catellatospora sp. TT07R-123]GHJ47139.1 hypothetical protein Cs7R123_44810 [Catellatospora sp. TT07R-123]